MGTYVSTLLGTTPPYTQGSGKGHDTKCRNAKGMTESEPGMSMPWTQRGPNGGPKWHLIPRCQQKGFQT